MTPIDILLPPKLFTLQKHAALCPTKCIDYIYVQTAYFNGGTYDFLTFLAEVRAQRGYKVQTLVEERVMCTMATRGGSI
jgi:hypothetical protein